MAKQFLTTPLTSDVLLRAIESTNSPLIITDNKQEDNPIVYANQAFLDLCGYDKSEVIGHNCRFLQGKDSDKKAIKTLRDAIKGGYSARVTLKNYRKDGTAFWNDLLVSPIEDNDGNVTHFMGVQLDITDPVEHTKILEDLTLKLSRSNEELEQFTYAASHDLQEPLRMVSSYLQLLSKRYGTKFDEDAELFINYAVEGAERMQSLINDLLTLSRVSSTDNRFKSVAFNDVIDKVLFNLKQNIDETNSKIIVGEMPTAEVDAVQMVQLFQNLIGNAIKYAKPNTQPSVEVTASQQGDKYLFSVTDNGIGIDEQYRQRVFIIFQRLHTREEYSGTGIGLAICSKIIERHNGKIWVDDNPKGGSIFKFTIPINRKGSSDD